VRFLGTSNDAGADFAAVTGDSNRGIWRLEVQREQSRSFGSRWTDPPSSPNRGLGRPRYGRTTALAGSPIWRLEMRVGGVSIPSAQTVKGKRKTFENSLLGVGAVVCFLEFTCISNRQFAIRKKRSPTACGRERRGDLGCAAVATARHGGQACCAPTGKMPKSRRDTFGRLGVGSGAVAFCRLPFIAVAWPVGHTILLSASVEYGHTLPLAPFSWGTRISIRLF
jgi:hypothetical protein